MASIPNIYMHRKVADTAAKSCEICYKPSTSVLVTAENKDFFFVCPSHLKDKGFCSPIIDEAAVAAKKKKEMDAEVERVRKEFEEKQKKKKEKEKEKSKDKDNDKSEDKKEDRTDKNEDKVGQEQSTQDTSSSAQKKPDTTPKAVEDEEPRIFALQKSFYQQRLDKKRNAEIAKRNRERLQNPTLFPQVPKGFP